MSNPSLGHRIFYIRSKQPLPCDHRRIASTPFEVISATPVEFRTSQDEESMIKHGIPVMLNFLASAFLRVRSVNKVFIDNVYQI